MELCGVSGFLYLRSLMTDITRVQPALLSKSHSLGTLEEPVLVRITLVLIFCDKKNLKKKVRILKEKTPIFENNFIFF